MLRMVTALRYTLQKRKASDIPFLREFISQGQAG